VREREGDSFDNRARARSAGKSEYRREKKGGKRKRGEKKEKNNVGIKLNKNTTPYFLGERRKRGGALFLFLPFSLCLRKVARLGWLTSHVLAVDQRSDAVEQPLSSRLVGKNEQQQPSREKTELTHGEEKRKRVKHLVEKVGSNSRK